MKRSMQLVVFLFLGLFMVACSRKDPQSQLVGIWTTVGEYYEFKKDGTFELKNRRDGYRTGTYEIMTDGKTLVLASIKDDILRRILTNYDLSENGDQLVIEKSFSGTVVLRKHGRDA